MRRLIMARPNPIRDAELRYQQYVIRTSRAGTLWVVLALALMIPAFITAVVVACAVVLFDQPMPLRVFPAYLEYFSQIEPPWLVAGRVMILLLIVMNMAQTAVLLLVSFGLAVNSILREKTSHTWDIIRLTPISAGRLVRGKFWASLYALRGDHAIIAVLRVGLVAWGVRAFEEVYPPGGIPTSSHILILCGLAVVLTALDAALNTALSLAVALAELPGALMFALFAVARAVTLLFVIAWAGWVWQALADAPHQLGWLALALVGVMGYAGLVGLALWGARWAALRAGV